jgi:hypothetical protein
VDRHQDIGIQIVLQKRQHGNAAGKSRALEAAGVQEHEWRVHQGGAGRDG